jgi:peroxiredoxin
MTSKRHWPLGLLATALLALAACEAEDSDVDPNSDGNNGAQDAGNNGALDQGGEPDAHDPDANTLDQGPDAPSIDAGRDTEPLDVGDPDPDQGAQDLMIDVDAPSEDLGGDDASDLPVDAGVDDPDADAGPVDVGPADLDPADFDPVDGGPADLDPVDVGGPDVPPVDMDVEPDLAPDLPPVDMGEPDVAQDTGGGLDAGEPDLPPSLCPPQGPFGARVGDTIPDVSFPDCDGQMHSLHELCEHQVGWIFEFAAWCPPCRAFARTINALYLSFDREEVGAFVIISQNNNFGAPNAAFCQDIKRQYNLTDIPVLYDPDGRLQRMLDVPSNDINILTRQGGEIFFKRQYSSPQVEGAIEDELETR